MKAANGGGGRDYKLRFYDREDRILRVFWIWVEGAKETK